MIDLKNDNITYPLGDPRKKTDVLICVDVDKTLTETDHVWRARYQSHCVAPIPHRPVADDEISVIWDHFHGICRHCFMECLESPNILLAHEADARALEVMKSLVHDGVDGVTIGFHAVTARPEKAIQPTLDWFGVHGFDRLLRGVTFTENKRPFIESLGAKAHIDDSHGVYRSMTSPVPSDVEMIFLLSSVRTDDRIERVYHDWNEVETRLREIAAAAKIEGIK